VEPLSKADVISYYPTGLPDENFNKKPNKKCLKKAKLIIYRPEKSQTLLVVLLFLCDKNTPKLHVYH